MRSHSLKHYTDNFQSNLDAFLKEYVDNTKLIFLQKEKEEYTYILDVLITHKTNSANFKFQNFGEHFENKKPISIVIDYTNPDNSITSTRRILEFINTEIKNQGLSTTLNKTDNINLLSSSLNIYFEAGKHNPNLINDPLFLDSNNHNKIRNDFKNETKFKTANLTPIEHFNYTEKNEDYIIWREAKQNEIKTEFLKLTKKLNAEKIFFFGCSFDNYKSNYYKRLDLFLNYYEDTAEDDFICSEKIFLENVIDDFIQRTGYIGKTSKSGVAIFNKASYVITMISYEQYYFSNNKKIAFLNAKLLNYNGSSNNTTNEHQRSIGKQSKMQSEHAKLSEINKFQSNVAENILPSYNSVFFIHYQCDDFNVSDKITSLSIFADDKVIEFKNKSEAENIEEYCNAVKNLLERGLFPIHWSQNRPYYGAEHILSRYYQLTGNQIELEYKNSLNLSGILKHKFGEEYVNHPRLDNLAILNSFNGISTKEKGLRTFDANRVLLLSKIYFGILNKTLKIGNKNVYESPVLPEQSTNTIEGIEQSSLNDFMRLTIIEKLENVLTGVNTIQFGLLVEMLNKYFQNNRVTFSTNKVNLGRLNKKKVGWALKEIYTSITNESLSYEYLEFIKENVLLFRDVELKKDDFFYCNLYKYFTTKV